MSIKAIHLPSAIIGSITNRRTKMTYAQNYFDNMSLTPRGRVALEMYHKLMEWGKKVGDGRNEYYEEAGRVIAEYERLEALEQVKSEVI